MGLPPGAAERANAAMRVLYDAVKGAPDQAQADARLDAAWSAYAAANGLPAGTPTPAAVRPVAMPWMRWFLAYDPRPALARLRMPVLAVGGAKDVQAPPAENLAGIRAALAADPDATVVELPGLNHLLQTAGAGLPAEYAEITETLSHAALKLVGNWIAARTR